MARLDGIANFPYIRNGRLADIRDVAQSGRALRTVGVNATDSNDATALTAKVAPDGL